MIKENKKEKNRTKWKKKKDKTKNKKKSGKTILAPKQHTKPIYIKPQLHRTPNTQADSTTQRQTIKTT